MVDIFKNYQSFLIVAIGAAPGAILRMHLRLKLTQFKKSSFDGIHIVNIISTFLLGFTIAIHRKTIIDPVSQNLYLLICVGFLGSLSSFSSIVYESFLYILENKWSVCLVTIFLSISLGMIALLFGYHIGNV